MHVIKKAYAGQKVKKERRQKKLCLIGHIVIESHSFLYKLTELLNPPAGPTVESFCADNNVQNIQLLQTLQVDLLITQKYTPMSYMQLHSGRAVRVSAGSILHVL